MTIVDFFRLLRANLLLLLAAALVGGLLGWGYSAPVSYTHLTLPTKA